MKYFPEPMPFNPSLANLTEWMHRELQRVSDAVDQVHDHNVEHAEPARPREGMVRYADGTDWDPASGEGLYYYDGAAWAKL